MGDNNPFGCVFNTKEQGNLGRDGEHGKKGAGLRVRRKRGRVGEGGKHWGWRSREKMEGLRVRRTRGRVGEGGKHRGWRSREKMEGLRVRKKREGLEKMENMGDGDHGKKRKDGEYGGQGVEQH